LEENWMKTGRKPEENWMKTGRKPDENRKRTGRALYTRLCSLNAIKIITTCLKTI